MEDNTKALLEFAESNNKLIAKLDELKQEMIKDREHKKRRAEGIARNYKDLDIQFVMNWKGWNQQKATERLTRHNFNVAQVIRNGDLLMRDGWKEQVILHYEHKKNRKIIEKW